RVGRFSATQVTAPLGTFWWRPKSCELDIVHPCRIPTTSPQQGAARKLTVLTYRHRETERIKKMLSGPMTAINNGPAKNKKRSSVGGASPLEPRTDETTENRRPKTDYPR